MMTVVELSRINIATLILTSIVKNSICIAPPGKRFLLSSFVSEKDGSVFLAIVSHLQGGDSLVLAVCTSIAENLICIASPGKKFSLILSGIGERWVGLLSNHIAPLGEKILLVLVLCTSIVKNLICIAPPRKKMGLLLAQIGKRWVFSQRLYHASRENDSSCLSNRMVQYGLVREALLLSQRSFDRMAQRDTLLDLVLVTQRTQHRCSCLSARTMRCCSCLSACSVVCTKFKNQFEIQIQKSKQYPLLSVVRYEQK